MSQPDHNLTPKQAQLVAVLLEGKSLDQAAKAAGIAYVTAKRWRRTPQIAAALAEGRRELIASALDILTVGARAAAGEILTILRDRNVAPLVRLRAAEAVLERLHKWAELEDLESRIRALEEKHEQA
jgi:phage terminase small subunit